MTLSPQWLDELRARTTLSAVIAPSVKLIKAGREFKACCPFHQEKTPSFTVNDEKGFYHCLAAETLVITRLGRVPISKLAGQTVDVLARDGRWVAGTFANYGRQRLLRIELSRNGVRKTLFATSGHRWFVRGRKSALTTIDLRVGYRLESAIPQVRKEWTLDPEGIRHGIIFGDGTAYRGDYGTINLHGGKDLCLAFWFPDQVHHLKERAGGNTYLRIYGGRAFAGMKALPSLDRGDSYLLGFLAGYLAADGCVAKDGTIILNSASRDHLEATRDIAAALGIATYGLTTQMRRGFGRDESALHRIHFVPATMSAEMFLLDEARKRFEAQRKAFARLRWTVTGLEESGRCEDVYCAEVADGHAFALEDNILTGNCFGCGAHGDAIRFLTDHRGLPFMDAVKELAGKAGMEVPAPDPRDREKAERSAGLHDVMAAAQKWFADQLNGVDGGEARAYLANRGIDTKTIERFGIGYAPDSRGKLKAALQNLGEDKLIDTGLLINPEEERKDSYDRFRGRIMFPIRDARGRVIGFGGRILGAGEPKYLNSPDTVLFDKGRTLYNLDLAGPASRKAGRIIVVEGYMDVIALDRAGIAEAVAPNGTALTDAQLERLWRLEPAPICCFDGDSAGQKAAVRAAMRALPHLAPERTLRFVALPAGQDPDDIVRAGGSEAIEALLASPEPLVERLWRHEVEAAPLDTPEARAGLKQRLIEHSQAIADPNVRQLYRDEWLRKFDALVRPQQQHQARSLFPRREWRKQGGRFVPPPPPTLDSTRGVAKTGVEAPIARALLRGFILYPEALHDHLEELAHLTIADRGCASLRDQLVEIAMSGQHLDRDSLETILADKAANIDVRRGAMRFSFTRQGSNSEVARRDLAAALEAVIARTEIELALSEATRRLKQDVSESAFEEQQKLHAAREVINDRLASLASNE